MLLTHHFEQVSPNPNSDPNPNPTLPLTKIDAMVEACSPEGVPELRGFVRDNVMDILYYSRLGLELGLGLGLG